MIDWKKLKKNWESMQINEDRFFTFLFTTLIAG